MKAPKKSSVSSARTGSSFESLFQRLAGKSGCLAIRIPNGVRFVGGNRSVVCASPFDFIVVHPFGRVVFVDVKTVAGKSIHFRSSRSTLRQMVILSACAERGVSAGFCVYFRSLDKVVWCKARSDLRTLKYEDGSFVSLPGPRQETVVGDSGFIDLSGVSANGDVVGL
jgi:hypothetical protein